MSSQTYKRYIISVKPKRFSPFRRGWAWDAKNNKYRRVWISTFRRVYVTNGGDSKILTPKAGYHGLLTPAEASKVFAWAKTKAWDVESIMRVIDRYPHLTGDTDSNADLLRRLNAVAKDLGVKINVNSGLRTYEEQKALYEAYLAGQGPLAARPGTSNHEDGNAADCSINGVNIGSYSGARAAMKRHGLCLPVRGETWHVEVGNTWRA